MWYPVCPFPFLASFEEAVVSTQSTGEDEEEDGQESNKDKRTANEVEKARDNNKKGSTRITKTVDTSDDSEEEEMVRMKSKKRKKQVEEVANKRKKGGVINSSEDVEKDESKLKPYERWTLDPNHKDHLSAFPPRFWDETSLLCRSCGARGHRDTHCRQIPDRPCPLCANYGHTISMCPNELCWNCFSPGHKSNQCHNPTPPITCYRCGDNHDPVFCLIPRISSTEDVFCFNCGSQGHHGTHCFGPTMDQLNDLLTKNQYEKVFNLVMSNRGKRTLRRSKSTGNMVHLSGGGPRSTFSDFLPAEDRRDVGQIQYNTNHQFQGHHDPAPPLPTLPKPSTIVSNASVYRNQNGLIHSPTLNYHRRVYSDTNFGSPQSNVSYVPTRDNFYASNNVSPFRHQSHQYNRGPPTSIQQPFGFSNR
eukprot:TRINITY_DN251_c0_g2_i1.p1 TRINITY_DN251_c0_g2~~TRINITY_DN251_c0_g2_i1.p1  ORF type:complete len:426 (+),score=63.17 TRINITY_DN251_c0_g2_i1:23-1279(+)